MQTKIIFFTVLFALFTGFSALSQDCIHKIQSIEGSLMDLHYFAQDQEILSVFLTLKSLLKVNKSLTDICYEESAYKIDKNGEENQWIQGCQEGFKMLRNITSTIDSNEEKLQALRKLTDFYPVFENTCLYADDYLLLEILEGNDSERGDIIKGMIREFLDEEDRFVNEIVEELEASNHTKAEKEELLLHLIVGNRS